MAKLSSLLVKNVRQISAKPNHFLAKFAQKIPTKSVVFTDRFLSEISPEIFREFPAKSAVFSANL